MKNNSIRLWAEDDRPREKLITKGRQYLSNSELVALLLGSGSQNFSAIDVARTLLDNCQGSLVKLSRLDINELKKIRGIGPAKAVVIAAALELGRRRFAEPSEPTQPITSSKLAHAYLVPYLTDLACEEFFVLYMNQSSVPIGVRRINAGGIAETIVDVRLVFKNALELGATSIIAAHNHPSGNLNPSKADLDITQKIIASGKLMNIRILDHLIFGHNHYYSMADSGTISFT